VSTPIVWFVVPEGYDDPDRVSGGNVYDQRVEAELRRLFWDVRMVEAGAGDSVGTDPFDGIPDGELVLVDGRRGQLVERAVQQAEHLARLVGCGAGVEGEGARIAVAAR
jgi:hypothetical protein